MKFPSLLDLDTDQRKVLDFAFEGCHVVTGVPGSGKTVMALYRAWALATAGRTVTVLTRANLLRQYLEQQAPDFMTDFGITTYHRWVGNFWRTQFATDAPTTDSEGWDYDWIEMQQDCMEREVRSNTHLVIDEGQNLPVAFYQWCRILGFGVTVFADHHERIDDGCSTVPEICGALSMHIDPLTLHQNHRSTRDIARLAGEFSPEAGINLPLPERTGRRPWVRRVSSIHHLLDEVARYFKMYPRRSIGIICRSTQLLREVQGELTRLGLARHTQAYVHNDRLRKTVNFSTRPIKIVSTASMKGLEFDSVFVPDLDAYTEDPTGAEVRVRFFVLCTRARKDLCFAYLGPDEPPILSAVAKSLLARNP
ncbi:hypothetical protein ABZV91_30300 [Nocardia sp. NPDC004568]|uniref:hypothetical protein n=1 Tax=Nocardia sp. NPDC004568 TaxID=3154551 RepID=UPI0033B8BB56